MLCCLIADIHAHSCVLVCKETQLLLFPAFAEGAIATGLHRCSDVDSWAVGWEKSSVSLYHSFSNQHKLSYILSLSVGISGGRRELKRKPLITFLPHYTPARKSLTLALIISPIDLNRENLFVKQYLIYIMLIFATLPHWSLVAICS